MALTVGYRSAVVLFTVLAHLGAQGASAARERVGLARRAAATRKTTPYLRFPAPGTRALYGGRSARFFLDTHHNPFQVAIDAGSGRVRQTWGNGHNESLAFTVRLPDGRPAAVRGSGAAVRLGAGGGLERFVEHELAIDAPSVEIGHIVLDSVRLERDLQDRGFHLAPWGGSFTREADRPFARMIELLARLPPAERQAHLEVLGAARLRDLEDRVGEQVSAPVLADGRWQVSVQRTTIDGRYRMRLDLSVPAALGRLTVQRGVVRLDGRRGPIPLTVRSSTNAAVLRRPLQRDEIFGRDFLAFASRVKQKGGAGARWLERNLRATELLTTDDKVLAGLDNYGTYFGRDSLMTALMNESIWSVDMLEDALGSVLRRTNGEGRVSHEESLGYQAYRENAQGYNRLLEAALAPGDGRPASAILREARGLAGRLNGHHEDYQMVDAEFILTVLAARYLARPDVSDARKREFLEGVDAGGAMRDALLRNLGFVIDKTRAYAADPRVDNLISFRRGPDGAWLPLSWRDSVFGYAGGRYPMDVNGVWAPAALRSAAEILDTLERLGVASGRREAWSRGALAAAARTWDGALEHFRVSLPEAEVGRRLEARLAAMPAKERAHWQQRAQGARGRALDFYAVSLDGQGAPIPVMSSDVASLLFAGRLPLERVRTLLTPVLQRYPLGLRAGNLGVLAANDTYAGPEVWRRFERDRYHSPRVAWGRENNLLLLGIGRSVLAGRREGADVRDLERAFEALHRDVAGSPLRDNELSTYEIQRDRLVPTRYLTTSDIQAWNGTALAVEFMRERLRAVRAPPP